MTDTPSEASSPANPETSNSRANSSSSPTSDNRVADLPPRQRKRRVNGIVTPNACTNCQKARAKCDGAKPACSRCSGRSMEDCRYEVHAKTAKDLMLREIRQLQRKNEDLEEQHNTMAEKHAWAEQIIKSFADEEQCVELVQRLRTGESPQSIAEWLSSTSDMDITATVDRYRSDLVENGDLCFWSNVTPTPTLLDHLITLYLTWIHPFHMLFDEVPFVDSFKSCSDTYCSAALVNAICAMACCLLTATPNSDEQTDTFVADLKKSFLDEAKKHLRTADPNKMTTIQTYSVIFLFELGSGTGLMATSHLRLASETLIAKRDFEQGADANSIAFWGVLTLFTTWSGFLYIKPTIPVSPKKDVFRGIPIDVPGMGWRAYRQPEDADMAAQHGHSVSASCELAKLYRVVHETILLYCAAYGLVNSDGVLRVWKRYVEWKHDLPEIFQKIDETSDPLPYVLALHIQYHVALINLFEPLLYLEQPTDSNHSAIADLLVKHAREGVALLIRYRQRYGAAYQTPIQLFCTVHICDAIVSHDRDASSCQDTIRFCIESLAEAKASYPLAVPLQKMFATSLEDLNIALPDDLAELIGPPSTYQIDELLSACTRMTYRAPIAQMLPSMKPTLAQDFVDEWSKACKRGDEGMRMDLDGALAVDKEDKSRAMRIKSLLNDD